MDLEPYGLTYAASASSDTTPTTASNEKGKGKADQDDTGETSAGAAGGREPLPTIEEDVKQLVQGVSSWWSGFSQRSQAQFTQAQQHIASQGGLVSFAKKEASRLEAQLEETRLKAKEKKESEEEEERKKRAEELELEKQHHAKDEQSDGEVSSDGTKSRNNASAKAAGGSGTASERIFDADEATEASESTPKGTFASRGASPTTSSSSPFALDSTLFGRLQTLSSDPRVASIQKDLASRLSSSFSLLSNTLAPSTTSTRPDTREAGDETQTTSATTTLSSTLQEISSTLSNISSPEAKAYAQKYLKASEELVGKMGEEVKGVVNDLIKVVPPADADGKNHKTDVTSLPPTVEGQIRSQQTSEGSSEFSSWDLADSSEKGDVETPDGEGLTGSASGAQPSESRLSAKQQPEGADNATNSTSALKTESKTREDDSGDDSDWD